MCRHTYARPTIPHGCNARDRDFVMMNTRTGVKGAEAKKQLENFIEKEQNSMWKYVPAMHDESHEHEREESKVKSEVKKVEWGREPNENDKGRKSSNKPKETE